MISYSWMGWWWLFPDNVVATSLCFYFFRQALGLWCSIIETNRVMRRGTFHGLK